MIGEGLSVAVLQTVLPEPPWRVRGYLYARMRQAHCTRAGDGCPACTLFAPLRIRRDGKPRDEVRPIALRESGGHVEVVLFGRAVELGQAVARLLPDSAVGWIRPDGSLVGSPVASPLSTWMRPVRGTLVLRLLSPLRLTRQGKVRADGLDLRVLALSVAARLRRLRSSVGDGVWEDPDVDAALEEANSATLTAGSFWRERLRRVSSRQAREVWLDGLVGWARLEGVGAALGRLLAAGAVVQAGKGVVFGCGQLTAQAVDAGTKEKVPGTQ